MLGRRALLPDRADERQFGPSGSHSTPLRWIGRGKKAAEATIFREFNNALRVAEAVATELVAPQDEFDRWPTPRPWRGNYIEEGPTRRGSSKRSRSRPPGRVRQQEDAAQAVELRECPRVAQVARSGQADHVCIRSEV
jgi:hypothetical protein